MCSVGFVDSKRENTNNVQNFVRKARARAFWDSGELLLWELLDRDVTVDTENSWGDVPPQSIENCWRNVPPQSIERIVGEMCRHNRYRQLVERCADTIDIQNCWRDVLLHSIQRIVGEIRRHNRYTELFVRCTVTVDTPTYLPTIKKLTLRILRFLPNRKLNQVHLLPYDKALPHISLRTREAITAKGWINIFHPLCRHGLEPTDYNQFGPLNDSLQGHHKDIHEIS
jgi:hypothetical protein